jgi:Dyp-type peroxidase family
MRTTGGDVFVHLRCAERDHLYHAVVAVEREASAAGATMEHTHGWRDGSAGRNNDLTGFEDGVQNCPATAVSREVFLPANSASACGSFLLAQTWRHNFTLWQSLPVAEQEAVFGRSKYTSARLPHPAPNAHSVKVSQSALGFDVLRLSSPYGQDQNNAGLIFLAYSKSGDRLVTMCESMVRGAPLGRDRLMGVSHCFASNLYYVPSANVLDRLLLPLILGK